MAKYTGETGRLIERIRSSIERKKRGKWLWQAEMNGHTLVLYATTVAIAVSAEVTVVWEGDFRVKDVGREPSFNDGFNYAEHKETLHITKGKRLEIAGSIESLPVTVSYKYTAIDYPHRITIIIIDSVNITSRG